MPTITGTVTIEDPIGFHARPAGQIVKFVKESGLEIRIGKVGENLVKANSPLSLMALKGKTGEQVGPVGRGEACRATVVALLGPRHE